MNTSLSYLIIVFSICLAGASVCAETVFTAGVPLNFPPQYVNQSKTEKPKGFAIDIMDEIARRSGFSVKYVVYETWPLVWEAIKEGQVQVVPNVGISEDRRKILDFTSPVEAFHIRIFVRRSTTEINALKDLAQRKVGVVSDNIGAAIVEVFGESSVIYFQSLDEALLNLLSANIDALVYPAPPLIMLARKSGIENYIKTVGESLIEVKRAVGVRKGQPELLQKIKSGLASLLKDTVFADIYTKWYGKPKSFLTGLRIASALIFLLIIVILGLLVWRYVSVMELNKALKAAFEKQDKTEKELRGYQDKLVERIDERTKELKTINKQLKIVMDERRKREIALEKSEAQLKEAQQVARMGHWNLDLVTNSLTWSDKIFRIFELDQDEFDPAYEAFLEKVHPEDRSMVENAFRRSVEIRSPYDIAHRLLMPDGRIKWVHEKAKTIYDQNENAICSLGTVQDITSIKENEARTLREIRRMAFLVELHKVTPTLEDQQLYDFALENAVALTDSEIGYLHRVNEDQKTIALTIWNREACKNCTAVHETHYPIEQAGVWADSIRLKQPVIHNDYQNLRDKKGYPSGHSDLIRHMSIPVTESGKVRLVFGVGNKKSKYDEHDVNMLQVIANALQKIIEHQQTEAEKNIMEIQLRQAQKMESIGTLAGGVAHDFNNILTIIIDYSEMMAENMPPGDPLLIDVEQVILAGRRAKDLVKQILAFSRQCEQEYRPVKVPLIAREVLKFLRSSIPSTITIENDIEDDCGEVLADPVQIHQVIMNLCTNAFHALRETGGIIKITLLQVELDTGDMDNKFDFKPGPYIKLSVSDTGKGMDRLTMERIFDPYFTTKSKGEGTGLGLAIVHGIVKNTGGTITVYSELQKGTAFHIYLPVTKATDVSDTLKMRKKIPRGSEHILVVDDEEPISEMFQKMLTKLEYQVTVQTNGYDALKAFEDSPDAFDMIITDMTMPGMTGVELARIIFASRPSVTMILCTGFSELIDEEKAKEIGFSAFIMKPIITGCFLKMMCA
ncbi:MAG: transporter substrate-binding domain-containing protein [Proteobacteria bacterium]|nr:transporter substrate-binding domain-containing protein [Pseudomonadota bacterium]